MRTSVFATLLALSALLLAAVPVTLAADQRPLDTTPDLKHESPPGYYLWRSDGTLHLRTHGPGAEHDFDAVLRTDGTFENVDAVKLDPKNGDHIDLRDGGHELAIHFHTFDFTDGVNFTVRDGAHVRFNLKLDNHDISTDSIFIGAEGRHPKSNPFRIKLQVATTGAKADLMKGELNVAAKALGLADAKALRQELRGSTLNAVAQKHNVPATTVSAAIKADVDAKIGALAVKPDRQAGLKQKADARVDRLMTKEFKTKAT